MTFREYFEHLDASIEASVSVLLHTSREFLLVLIIVPIQILYLVFRCVFPFLNPFIDKFVLTDDD
jgi:hypothetical protein